MALASLKTSILHIMKTIFQITFFVCAPWLLHAQSSPSLFQTGDINIKALTVSLDGRTVAVVGDGADVGLWDLGTRKKTMNLQRKKQDRQSTLLNLAQMLKDAEHDGEEKKLDKESMELLNNMDALGSVVSFALSLPERAFFNSTGSHLILCHRDGVVVWDIKKAQPQLEFFAKPDFYDVSSDGQHLVIIEKAQVAKEPFHPADIAHADPTFDDNILIYNIADGKKTTVTLGSRSETKRVRFLPGTANVMVLGVTGDRYTIDGASAAVTHEADVYKCSAENDLGYVNENTQGVTFINASLALHPNLPLVATTDLENHLIVYDLANRQKKFSLQISEGVLPGYYFEVLQFTPNGKYLFGIRQNYTVDSLTKSYQFWDVNTGKELKPMNIGTVPWSNFYFSPDGRWFVTAKLDTKKTPPFVVTVYDASTLTQTETFQGRGPFTIFPNDSKRLLFFSGTGVGVYNLKP